MLEPQNRENLRNKSLHTKMIFKSKIMSNYHLKSSEIQVVIALIQMVYPLHPIDRHKPGYNDLVHEHLQKM